MAPPLSWVLAEAVACLPNSQPELMKLFKTLGLSKTKTTLELLHADSESCLQFDHLHESFFLRLVVDGDAFAFAGACKQDLHAHVIEDSLPGGAFDRCLGHRFCLVKLLQSLLGNLPDLLLFLRLLVFGCVRGQGKCICQGNDNDVRFHERCGSILHGR